MTPPPNRSTTAGRVYLDLRALARRQGRGTDELLVLYVLERFLYRVSVSEHRDRLVLKGGMLLAALDERRPTRDIDLLATALANDIDTAADLVREIVGIKVDDGVQYDPDALTAGVIREADQYGGVRLAVPAAVDRARAPLRIDISVGDPVTPAPVHLDFPSLLGDSFAVCGYPLETVLAEKLVTMIDRAQTNTRDRDFADVVLLTTRHPIDADTLRAAIAATARHRGVTLRPLTPALATIATTRQAPWEKFLASTGLQAVLPHSLHETIARVIAFAEPVLSGEASGRWQPSSSTWHRSTP